MCSCPTNTTGNAFFSCNALTGNYRSYFIHIKRYYKINIILKLNYFHVSYFAVPPVRRNPCQPSPCGPNSVCRTMHEQAVCSCLIGYIGVPPSCRPECLVDSDCTSVMSCSNQKCADPCRGSCGLNAECRVHNHKPICYCPNGYNGDPFTLCKVIVHSKYILHNYMTSKNNCVQLRSNT